jgi:probable F420-dependent oxidoreductase
MGSPVNTADGLTALALLGESAGFESLWCSDHLLVPRENAERYGNITEVLITLAFIAGITRRVALGTSVLVLPMRNPIVAAKQLATLDVLSGGRTIVGVGVGWNATEYGWLKADFKHRGALIDEYIAIMRELWTADGAQHEGTYSFKDAFFGPKPARLPPLWIGGESNAAVKRAAQMGDGWQPNDRGLDEFRAKVADLKRYAGERPVTVSVRSRVDMNEGAQAAIDRFSSYSEAGLEYPVVQFPHDGLSDLTAQIEAFARDVMPNLKDR